MHLRLPNLSIKSWVLSHQSNKPPIANEKEICEWFVNDVLPQEIERRNQSRALDDSFQLTKAQLILNIEPGQNEPTEEIRLNEEVKFHFSARIDETFDPTEDSCSLVQLGELIAGELSAKDPNAAHITVVYHKDAWNGFVDLRFNATRIAEHLKRARQYLNSAKRSLDADELPPTIDALFTATELMIKAILMMMPDGKILGKTGHGYPATLYYKFGDEQYQALFKTLTNLRNPARYPEHQFKMTTPTATELWSTAESLFANLTFCAPRRNMTKPGQDW